MGVGGGGGGEWSDDSCTPLRSLPFHFFQCPLSPIPAVNHRLSGFSPAIIYLPSQNNGFECQVVKKPPCFGTWVVTCCSAGDDPVSLGFQFSGPKVDLSHTQFWNISVFWTQIYIELLFLTWPENQIYQSFLSKIRMVNVNVQSHKHIWSLPQLALVQ